MDLTPGMRRAAVLGTRLGGGEEGTAARIYWTPTAARYCSRWLPALTCHISPMWWVLLPSPFHKLGKLRHGEAKETAQGCTAGKGQGRVGDTGHLALSRASSPGRTASGCGTTWALPLVRFPALPAPGNAGSEWGGGARLRKGWMPGCQQWGPACHSPSLLLLQRSCFPHVPPQPAHLDWMEEGTGSLVCHFTTRGAEA